MTSCDFLLDLPCCRGGDVNGNVWSWMQRFDLTHKHDDSLKKYCCHTAALIILYNVIDNYTKSARRKHLKWTMCEVVYCGGPQSCSCYVGR